jgi:hypothetical protein
MQEKLTIKERIQLLTPGQVIWPLIIILIVLGVIVGIVNYQKNVTANKVPAVAISTPADNTTVTENTVILSGTVDEDTKVVVNNKAVPVDKSGKYSAKLTLAPGSNRVTIVATGKNGKSKIVTRQVTREVPVAINSAPASQAPQAVAGSLTSSGPENFWIPEAALFAAAVVGWFMTKQNLAKAALKR